MRGTMADKTAISWTHHTWNPWRGCHKVSPGCAHCYIFMAQQKLQRQTGDLNLWDPKRVQRTKTRRDPFRWQRICSREDIRERVFTCSWSDWFIEETDEWRPEAWNIIRACPNLDFQILTKRPERIMRNLPRDWGTGYRNVWLGVSVEGPRFLWRIDLLRRVPSRVRFVSAEPLLAPLRNMDLTGIHQVIVGGESGPGFRSMPHEWPREILAQCRAAGCAFFFKQSAAIRTEMGTKLDGKLYREYPVFLRVG